MNRGGVFKKKVQVTDKYKEINHLSFTNFKLSYCKKLK